MYERLAVGSVSEHLPGRLAAENSRFTADQWSKRFSSLKGYFTALAKQHVDSLPSPPVSWNGDALTAALTYIHDNWPDQIFPRLTIDHMRYLVSKRNPWRLAE
jgi:hypothetical protein